MIIFAIRFLFSVLFRFLSSMGDNPSDCSFKKNDCESGASSSSSPDKKRSRFSASSPILIVSSFDDETTKKTLPQNTERKSPSEQSSSATLPSWVAGASPAKFISLEDLVRMSDCVEKMSIAHKIATDPNCKVEDFQTADPLYVCVKSNMRKAYWALLREDLAKEPPEYGHTFLLLEELKQLLTDQLEGDQLKSFLGAVDDILDMDKLKSQVDIDGLNIEAVLKAVLRVIERLCAPIRDEMVENLKNEADTVKLFEGIFSLVEFMQTDMTNFKISQNRQIIRSYSAQIEFEEFKKLMEIDGSSSDNTKRWLSKILDDFLSSSELRVGQEGLTRAEVNELIDNFYLALLTTNRCDSNRIPFPETLKLDEKHFDALSEKFLQLELTLSAIFISSNLVGKGVCEGSNFKSELKRDLVAILNDINWSNSDQKLDNIYVQCEHKCGEAVNGWDDERRNTLRRQLDGICRMDDPIREIARKRLTSFIGHALLRRNSPLRIPPGLSTIESELASLTSRFYAITAHNWNGFGRFYGQLLDQLYEAKRNT